jgi:hypothetical protein
LDLSFQSGFSGFDVLKENLSANNWTNLAGDILTSASTASKADTTVGNGSQRFYRVVLLP